MVQFVCLKNFFYEGFPGKMRYMPCDIFDWAKCLNWNVHKYFGPFYKSLSCTSVCLCSGKEAQKLVSVNKNKIFVKKRDISHFALNTFATSTHTYFSETPALVSGRTLTKPAHCSKALGPSPLIEFSWARFKNGPCAFRHSMILCAFTLPSPAILLHGKPNHGVRVWEWLTGSITSG